MHDNYHVIFYLIKLLLTILLIYYKAIAINLSNFKHRGFIRVIKYTVA